jgi:hypothetical protein
MTTKQDIFDLFYEKQTTSRSGGGKLTTKMAGRKVTETEQDNMTSKIKENPELVKYYNKLLARDPSIAPPPRPN